MALALSAAACTRDLSLIDTPTAVARTTTGPWASMIYLARTDSGVIVIDLGWIGAEREIHRGLATLHASQADVRYVFLTHAHRDHVSGWPAVRTAQFIIGAGDVPYFFGDSTFHAALPRAGEDIAPETHPPKDEIRVVAISRDTAFVLGKDTVYAFTVPGHTPGSMAYLFRGVLFAGDAINWRPWTGFRGARPEFSEDVETSRASMRALWQRLDSARVRIACSSHAKCGRVDAQLRAATIR